MFLSRKIAALAAALILTLAGTRAWADPVPIGAHSLGYENFNGHKIYLVAVEFGGTFDYGTANKAFRQALDRAMKTGWTADMTGQQVRRLAANRYVLFGWKNANTNEVGFVAVQMVGKTQSYRIKNTGYARRTDTWVTETWTTNRSRINIRLADDDRGGIAWYFYRN